jgi:hypothetical protein
MSVEIAALHINKHAHAVSEKGDSVNKERDRERTTHEVS